MLCDKKKELKKHLMPKLKKILYLFLLNNYLFHYNLSFSLGSRVTEKDECSTKFINRELYKI